MQPVEINEQLVSELEYFDGVINGYNDQIQYELLDDIYANNFQIWKFIAIYTNEVTGDNIAVVYNRHNETYYYVRFMSDEADNPDSMVSLIMCETDLQLYHTPDFFSFVSSIL